MIEVDDYMQVSSNAKEENIADKDWGNLAGKNWQLGHSLSVENTWSWEENEGKFRIRFGDGI